MENAIETRQELISCSFSRKSVHIFVMRQSQISGILTFVGMEDWYRVRIDARSRNQRRPRESFSGSYILRGSGRSIETSLNIIPG